MPDSKPRRAHWPIATGCRTVRREPWRRSPSCATFRTGCHRHAAALGDSEGAVAKAAEWLLDNEYLVARAVRQIEKDLPRGFYARLPTLSGSDMGRPRVWSIARALLRASRLQLSVPTVTRFLDAYQERTPLTIAELWALPTFLRLGCLEVLFAAFERLDPIPAPALRDRRPARHRARGYRVCGTRDLEPSDDRVDLLEGLLLPYESRRGDSSRGSRAHVPEDGLRDARRVPPCRSSSWPAAARIPSWTSLSGPSPALGRLSEALCGTPTSATGSWTRASRSSSGQSATDRSFDSARADGAFATPPSSTQPLSLAATAATIVLPAWYLTATRTTSPLATVLTLVVVLLPASTLAMTCVLWLVTMLVPPRTLPKLDFEAAIPDECRTAVVMPTLVGECP